MKVGDYVEMIDNSGYAFIQAFVMWEDELGLFGMVELLMDSGEVIETASDSYRVISESR
jgi:hypothetical protein